MTKPGDLTAFGNVPGDFIQTESKLIVPKSVTKDSPIEDLETPDQLEERPETVEAGTIKDTAVIENEDAKKADEVYNIKGIDLIARHPDWEVNPVFQIEMFRSMIELCEYEIDANMLRIDNLEIQLEHYKLWSSPSDLNEMRKLIFRNIEVQTEIIQYNASIVVREESLKPKGFWKNLFTRK